ncbi:MAG: hypothetical protein RR877_09545 [Aurantimicrobium sp.]
MSARAMFDSMNSKSPAACKEKHHGNKRRVLAEMKVKARRQERRENNKF